MKVKMNYFINYQQKELSYSQSLSVYVCTHLTIVIKWPILFQKNVLFWELWWS